jgi:hypothetical protein
MSNGYCPIPPEPYVVHPVAEVGHFVNREFELQAISDWARNSTGGPILTIVGLGGIGKTSLAWKWFSNLSEYAPKFRGRMWWSFYEDDSTHFFERAFSYLTGARPDSSPASPRSFASAVVRKLQDEPFLLVLDGFERQSVAYSRYLETRNVPLGSSHDPRRIVSSELSEFCRSCAAIRSGSKILLTSRLALVDFETSSGSPIEGTQVLSLDGLDESSTRDLLTRLGVVEGAERLVEIVASTRYHPLVTKLLAAVAIKDPAFVEQLGFPERALDTVQLRNHLAHSVLGRALTSLGPRVRTVAGRIASMKGAVGYSTLVALTVGEGKSFDRESDLDQALSRLEDLGVLNWNREGNAYDMHPVVRSLIGSHKA